MIFYFDEARAKIEKELAELQPYVERAQQLQRELAAMERAETSMTPRLRLSLAQRKEQVLALLRTSPGIRIVDVATALEVTHARAGQIVDALIDSKQVRKEGRLLFLV
jgi:hypothetical protein